MKQPVHVKFGTDARRKMLKGMETVYKAVSSTLGPNAKNVAINQAYGSPKIIHDGVSVAQSIELFDEFEDMGAKLIKQASINTNDRSGDGTTTSMILSFDLITKGLQDIEAGANSQILKKEIKEAYEISIKELSKLKREVKDSKDIEKVATISSADPEIGKMIAEAIEKVGKNGLVTTEEGRGFTTEIEYKSGLEFDRGYSSSSPYFVNDVDTETCILEDAYILMTDIKINYSHQLVPLMEKLLKENKKLVIFGEVQEEALNTLVVNKLRGVQVASVQAPSFGERRLEELEDIASVVGGVVIRSDSGRDIATVTIEELGHAEKVIIGKDSTKIQGGTGDEVRGKERISNITNQIEISKSDYEKEYKKTRLAKLTGGVAIIKVGAVNEVELSDRKERIVDAISAAKSAIEEGTIAGGQIAFLTISQMDIWPNTLGAKIFRESLKKPFKVLMENAGYDYAEKLSSILPIKYPLAIDATTGEVKDMLKSGIIDSFKVCRCALENAVSVAGMAYTTETLISEPYK